MFCEWLHHQFDGQLSFSFKSWFFNYRKHWQGPKVKSINEDTDLGAISGQLPTTTPKGTDLLVIDVINPSIFLFFFLT